MKKSKKAALMMAVMGLGNVSSVLNTGLFGNEGLGVANVAEAEEAAGQYTIYYEGYSHDGANNGNGTVVMNKYDYVFQGFNGSLATQTKVSIFCRDKAGNDSCYYAYIPSTNNGSLFSLYNKAKYKAKSP